MKRMRPKYLFLPLTAFLLCQVVVADALDNRPSAKWDFPCGNEIAAAVIRVPQDFASIQEAIAAANNDDTIILAPGTYTLTETVLVNKRITLTSEYMNTEDDQDIDNTIITGPTNLDPLVLFNESALDSKCIGLTFRGARKQLTTECEYMEVTYCKFFDNGSDALSIEAGGGYFAHNYFENNGDEAIDADDSLDWIAEYNIIINPGDDGFEIRLHNNDRSERLHIIRYNYISGADEDGIQLIDYDGDSGRTFQIHHNIIRNSAMVGLGCTRNGNTVEDFEGSNMVENTFVFNNVFDNNDHGITGAINMLVFNNIFTNSETVAIKKLDSNSSADYNCFFNNGSDFINASNGTNSIFENPLLQSDYSLEAESPCIEAGITTYAINGLSQTVDSADFLGNFPDIGTKEFTDGLPIENTAPLVSLGEDQVVLSPENSLLLLGTVTDDGLPDNNELSMLWTLESGPENAQVTFDDPTNAQVNITFSKQGVFEFKLEANDGERTASDKITVFYVNSYNDTTLELRGSLFLEAEDYRYLAGSAQVMGRAGASGDETVIATMGAEVCSYSEYRLVTFTEGTYYVWVNTTGIDQESNELLVAFNDLQQNQSVQALITNTYGPENWVKVVFENIPEGVYPLRISAAEPGVSWDRIFITTDENTLPYERVKEHQLYPVPNAGNFTIALSETIETKIKVFDIKGRLIYNTSVNNILFAVLDMPNLEKGVYVVTIENDTKKTTKKIIVN